MGSFKKSVELHPRLKLGVGRGYSKNLVLKFSGALFLMVAFGLSVNAVRIIATRATGNQEAIPQVLGVSDTRTIPETPTVEVIEYKVQKGDTLFNVSQRYNITWTTLATLNNLQTPYNLKPGQIIKIPK